MALAGVEGATKPPPLPSRRRWRRHRRLHQLAHHCLQYSMDARAIARHPAAQ
jgi:hypothetical protein